MTNIQLPENHNNNNGISGDQKISMPDIRESGDQEEQIAGFQRLWVWQKAHQLMLEIHNICKTLPREEKYRKKDQIERSSSSVPDNLAEGYTSYYYQDKIKGFNIARKEAGETQNHIIALQDKQYINSNQARELLIRYEEVIKGINGYIRWIREKRGDKKI